MKLILVSRRPSRTWNREITSGQVVVLSLCLLGASFLAGALSLRAWLSAQAAPASLNQETVRAWQATLDSQAAQIAALRSSSQAELATLARRSAEMHARLLRLDALGERVADMASLRGDEFDFGSLPALGGPEADEAAIEPLHHSPLQAELDRLSLAVQDREQQLDILASLLNGRRLREETFVTGRPVTRGWLSSGFGRRADPFHGRRGWHGGVDFAGPVGSDIVAVASGVVTESGYRADYGHMVEINHGNGYSTRYAHNQENKVGVGDIVKKGQVVALLGSTGRATGPHVHFEVYKHGRVVDPASYIARTLR